MKLSNLEPDAVREVVVQAHDIEQIYRLHGHRDASRVVRGVMAAANFSWLAWAAGKPVAVFGAAQVHDGVWQSYTMSTPDFPKVVVPLTRFIKRTVVPTLFGQVGIHRLECFLHQDNVAIHRWAEMLGFRKEFVKEYYAPDGAAYFGYAISTNPTKQSKVPPADV